MSVKFDIMAHRRSKSCDLSGRTLGDTHGDTQSQSDSTFMREMTDLVHAIYHIRRARRDDNSHDCA
jgi:hypothetical protein